ncbi:hypothetical protein ACP4OV_009385 [Aristida adscensionis]
MTVATQGRREHVVFDLPDTAATAAAAAAAADEGDHRGDGGVDGDRASTSTSTGCCGRFCRVVECLVAVAVLALLVAFIDYLFNAKDRVDPFPTYSAAVVAAAAGNGGSPPLAAPALFNLTFHISNPSKESEACVPRGAMAVVSRGGGGAPVAAGAVPPFCAGRAAQCEVTVPVWAMAAGAPDMQGGAGGGRGGADAAVPSVRGEGAGVQRRGRAGAVPVQVDALQGRAMW